MKKVKCRETIAQTKTCMNEKQMGNIIIIENSLNCHMMGQKIHSFKESSPLHEKNRTFNPDTEISRNSVYAIHCLSRLPDFLFLIFLCVFLFFWPPLHSLFIYLWYVWYWNTYGARVSAHIRFGHMNVLDSEIVSVTIFRRCRKTAAAVVVVCRCECLPFPLNDVSCFVFIISSLARFEHGIAHTHTQGEHIYTMYTQAPPSPQSHLCQSYTSFQLNSEMNQITSNSKHFIPILACTCAYGCVCFSLRFELQQKLLIVLSCNITMSRGEMCSIQKVDESEWDQKMMSSLANVNVEWWHKITINVFFGTISAYARWTCVYACVFVCIDFGWLFFPSSFWLYSNLFKCIELVENYRKHVIKWQNEHIVYAGAWECVAMVSQPSSQPVNKWKVFGAPHRSPTPVRMPAS